MNWDRLKQIAAVAQRAVTAPAAFAGDVIENHKGVRRALVVWAASLVTWVTVKAYTQDHWTPEKAAAYATTVGLIGTVLALYHIGRSKEEQGNDNGST